MANAHATQCMVFASGTVTLLARLVGWAATVLQRADITSLKYTVYSIDAVTGAATAVTGHENVALTVADVIFDALQTDARWTVDATGYNFRHTLAINSNAAFSAAGTYRIDLIVTPATGQPFRARWTATAI